MAISSYGKKINYSTIITKLHKHGNLKFNVFMDVLMEFPNIIRLKNKKDVNLTNELADVLIKRIKNDDDLKQLKSDILNSSLPLSVKVGMKLAESKYLVDKITSPISVTVVFAVYRELNRIKTAEEHFNGEDLLNVKLDQMKWLFDGNKNIKWEMLIVDDGCPELSGKFLEEKIRNSRLENVRVTFLSKGISAKCPATSPLTSPNDSQKGGSILYGLWTGIEESKAPKDQHILIYTDADLSTHLGQCGLLIAPIVNDGKNAVVGSRREEDSIVLKEGLRDSRGKLFIYLWKKMLPKIKFITDTQCGFKAFRADILKLILVNTLEKKFAFDIELILKAELLDSGKITAEGVAWIDSDAESTTSDLNPYLPMLKKIAAMNKKYLVANNETSEFCKFITSLSEDDWTKLVTRIPDEISEGNPADFENVQIRVKEFQSLLRG